MARKTLGAEAKEPETPRKPGRPSKYSPEVIETICARLSLGEPLAIICREEEMPAYHTVYDWMTEKGPDDQLTERASFVSQSIARARESGFDYLAAECLEIAEDGSNDYVMGKFGPQLDAEHVQRSKLRIETRLKLLAKWDPKRYGDKIQHADAEGNNLPAPQYIVAPIAPAKPSEE